MDLQDHRDIQGFRDLVASMESAMQETRVFLENLDHQENPVKGATRGFRGSVTCPCVIRTTTSENSTAKDPTSESRAARERLLRDYEPVTVSLICGVCVTVDFFMTKCVWRTATLEAEIT